MELKRTKQINNISIITVVVILFGGSTNLSAQTYELFVSSRNTSSVKYYDGTTGAYLGDFVSSGSGGLSATQEVVFGPDGHLYVSGRENTAVKKYNGVTGDYISDFTSGLVLVGPTKISFGPDSNLYVSQWGAPGAETPKKIVRFNATTGVFVDEFTSITISSAGGHAWDADGNLFVASFGSKNVQKFDANGVFLGIFAEAGHLTSAMNLWFDDSGDLLVVDFNAGSVLRFDGTTGAYKSVFISGMTTIEGATVAPDSSIFLTDWFRNEIVQYSSTGTRIGVFTTAGGMLQPNGLVFALTNRTVDSDKNTHGSLPLNHELKQNFPNPFNPETTIEYNLPKSTRVSLVIYSLLGEEVTRLVDGHQPAGKYKTTWNASNVASGIYFYRLQAGDFVQTKKMVLLK